MSRFFYLIRDYLLLKVAKYGSKLSRLTLVFSVNTLILGIHISILVLFLNYILKAYSYFNSFIDYINSLDLIFIKVLHSIAFFKAFYDVFNIFAPFFITIIYIYCSSFFVRVLESFRKSFDSVNLARID